MSPLKMRLGDPKRFALQLEIAGAADADHFVDPLTAASWGSFQLWVDGFNLCAHQEMGEDLDAVHWYLLPLIRWWIEHWDPIFHEERLPHPPQRSDFDAQTALQHDAAPPSSLDEDEEAEWLDEWQGWWQRHSLQAAREGGLFPDILLRRWRDEIEVSWNHRPIAGTPDHFRFINGPGFFRLPVSAVTEPVHELFGHALRHLQRQVAFSAHLETLVEQWQALKTSEQTSRVGWLSGLQGRWKTLSGRLQDTLPQYSLASEHLFLTATNAHPALALEGSCQAPMMFGCLAPDITSDDFMTLAEVQLRSFEKQRPRTGLDTLAAQHPLQEGMPPWAMAYELAENLLTTLAVDSTLDLDALLEELGVEVHNVNLSDHEIRGLAFVSPDQRPTVAVNVQHPANQKLQGRRFTLAHELCHLLFDRGQGQRLSLASGPWTSPDIEQRANAFAAMLLMPKVTIRSWIRRHGSIDSADALRQFARDLQVGVRSALDHLSNLRFLSEAQRSHIEEEFS